jgi:NADH-quinone oxidoreductase subunit G
MPFIEINGHKIEAEAGAMIIEVADNLGVQIPRFCYHKKLSIAANCRMCLVEVEKTSKPVPACATPITEGMKIWTRSPKTLLAQKAVMEFLLINHPLDCPICDQGGECELQDLSFGYGNATSRYTESKRVVQDKDIGPLIATDMTRCIQCTRCVRFGAEIAGIRELGATGRGECMEIGTYIERSVDSEISGNIIDICPVGALTSKPYRFTARGWELKQAASIAPHDCVGSNIFVHTRRDQVMRVVPRENEEINEIWISDRDRFSYEALYSEERLQQPKIKRDGCWYTASWPEALEYAVNGLIRIVREMHPSAIGALISPTATIEECYLLQQLVRGLGTDNIDHRLRQRDFSNQHAAPLFPNLGVLIPEIEQQSVVLLLGSFIQKEQPIIGLKLRKMTMAGGKVLVINPIDFSFNFDVALRKVNGGGEWLLEVARVAKAILNKTKTGFSKDLVKWLAAVEPQEIDHDMAELLIQGEKKLILIGALGLSHPAFSQLMALADLIAQLTRAKVGLLTEGANSAGAWLAGCVPHRLPGGESIASDIGLNALQMLERGLEGYLLFNVEPKLDCLEGVKAHMALQKARWVVVLTPFESESLLEVADVLLPITPFTEMSGTFVNAVGQWQSFQAMTNPLGESRPGWKVLRVLGNLCDLPEFEYGSSEQVLQAIQHKVGDKIVLQPWSHWDPACLGRLAQEEEIIRIAPVPLYATDNLVRRAKSLQQTEDAGRPLVHFNAILASRLNLKSEYVEITCDAMRSVLRYVIDESVPDNTIMLASGLANIDLAGGPYSVVKICSL